MGLKPAQGDRVSGDGSGGPVLKTRWRGAPIAGALARSVYSNFSPYKVLKIWNILKMLYIA
jgi:hypothetical protein